MAATFPGGVKSFTTKVDGVDDVMAVDVNGLQDEVVALETYSLQHNAFGATFPASPTLYDRFFNTTFGKEFYWDGTYWLTLVEKNSTPTIKVPQSATANVEYYTVRTDINAYFTYAIFRAYVISPNDSSNYWKLKFGHYVAGVTTVLVEVSTATKSSGIWYNLDTEFTTHVMDNPDFIVFAVEKIGSPGNLYMDNIFFYRERGD